MASLNKVFLIGRLTRDPELRYTSEGTAVADLNMAVSRKFTSRSGEQKEDVLFVSVTVWRKQAEACSEYLFKGSSLFVEGSLRLDKWETQDGQRRSRIRVVAQRVQFLGSPRKKTQNTGNKDDDYSEDVTEEKEVSASSGEDQQDDDVPF